MFRTKLFLNVLSSKEKRTLPNITKMHPDFFFFFFFSSQWCLIGQTRWHETVDMSKCLTGTHSTPSGQTNSVVSSDKLPKPKASHITIID